MRMYLLIFLFWNIHAEEQKRILLNDPAVLQSTVNRLEQEVQQLKLMYGELSRTQYSAGTTYVRWGRTGCPVANGTDLVYSGVVGGSPYHTTGGGVDYLCLPHDPSFIASTIVLECPACVNSLFGGEYQFGYNNVKQDDDVPCAVCHVKAQTTLLVPTHNNCPVGWRKEYNGLLSSGNDALNMPSQFVCLDTNPEYIEGTRSHNDNGKLFYPVRTVCGSLPCPPYEEGKFLPCVICSK